MKHNPLVSVIVPVYNVEDYLTRCVDTILRQTYRNLQVILVDDGSTDGSSKIAKDFAAKDTRIVLITTKNNGLSAARNKGMERADGEYFTFIDSDDYVTEDYVQFMLDLLETAGPECSMAICSLYDVYSNGHVDNMGDGSRQVLTGKECIEKMCYHDLVDTCAYAKLAKRNLYSSVKFPVGKLFEDIGTTYRLFDQCASVACGFSPKYYYGIRDGSIVNAKFSLRKLDLLEMTDQMADFVNQKYPDLLRATLRRQIYARFSTLNQMLDVKTVEFAQTRRQIIQYIRQHGAEVLQDKKAPSRDKIAIILLKLGYPIYRFVWVRYLSFKKGRATESNSLTSNI